MRSLFTHQDGDTALHLAARDDEYNKYYKEGRVKCVRALLSHPGIDVNIKNNIGHRAMMVHMTLLYALYSTSMCILHKCTRMDHAHLPCVFHHHRFLKGNC